MIETTTTNATIVNVTDLPINVPSLCIPRVYPNITESRIRKILDELKIGIIDRLDIVSKTTEKGEKYNRVFVHFVRWFKDGNAEIARERLVNGKDIKIIYDDPWFWKVSMYRHDEGVNNPNRYKKPAIKFESSNDEEQINRTPKIKPVSRPYVFTHTNMSKCKKEDIEISEGK